MKDDPGISKIREARHRISAECGHDPKKLVKYYMERQKKHLERLVEGTRETVPEQEVQQFT